MLRTEDNPSAHMLLTTQEVGPTPKCVPVSTQHVQTCPISIDYYGSSMTYISWMTEDEEAPKCHSLLRICDSKYFLGVVRLTTVTVYRYISTS